MKLPVSNYLKSKLHDKFEGKLKGIFFLNILAKHCQNFSLKLPCGKGYMHALSDYELI